MAEKNQKTYILNFYIVVNLNILVIFLTILKIYT
nr:MAG TPA: hypothetical protein [Caudoviricetes sp.]